MTITQVHSPQTHRQAVQGTYTALTQMFHKVPSLGSHRGFSDSPAEGDLSRGTRTRSTLSHVVGAQTPQQDSRATRGRKFVPGTVTHLHL